MAALKFGLVFNPLNPSYSEKELNYFIGDFNPDLVLVSPDINPKIKKIIKNKSKIIEINDFINIKNGRLYSSLQLSYRIFSSTTIPPGTTGLPKPIGLSHENSKVDVISPRLRMGP